MAKQSRCLGRALPILLCLEFGMQQRTQASNQKIGRCQPGCPTRKFSTRLAQLHVTGPNWHKRQHWRCYLNIWMVELGRFACETVSPFSEAICTTACVRSKDASELGHYSIKHSLHTDKRRLRAEEREVNVKSEPKWQAYSSFDARVNNSLLKLLTDILASSFWSQFWSNNRAPLTTLCSGTLWRAKLQTASDRNQYLVYFRRRQKAGHASTSLG